jgi:hypothetical protein
MAARKPEKIMILTNLPFHNQKLGAAGTSSFTPL